MGGESFPDKSLETSKVPFYEIRLAQDNKCSFSIEGNPEVIHLRPQEFRLLMILKKARGALVDQDSIESFFYGEPEGDLPLNSVAGVIASRLRLKLEAASSDRKKARGALVDQDSIESFFYGEPEGDLPLNSVAGVIASRLRLKLEAAS